MSQELEDLQSFRTLHQLGQYPSSVHLVDVSIGKYSSYAPISSILMLKGETEWEMERFCGEILSSLHSLIFIFPISTAGGKGRAFALMFTADGIKVLIRSTIETNASLSRSRSPGYIGRHQWINWSHCPWVVIAVA
jgi:hypothetical protein